ncbi:glutathione peroxidase [Luteipulveratus mongoliensis]|uniref:Glutathione peroxidase n=1 Tax=Luteipulveratus mongoliensis TaxID=571913 RepID=A0A0K1JDA2_9MICO|nr:glutathione peroxidase [Luteipulveratus mongoliensis]AKU14692.1 glutathione peroxidase [Luteipulveratus mongoliensis]
MTALHDFTATTLSGTEQSLKEYDGQVTLVVNTASKCAFTPQYEGLEKLFEDYGDQGFVVLGFPCDQFAHQEPGGADEIGAFCQKNYGVSFPMFDKVDVNGQNTHPLYAWLKDQKGGAVGSRIKWNFTKFLVGKDGQVIKRYGSTTKPEKIADDIKAALAVTAPAE